jgi:DNA polymerase-3 subunit epsilon
MFPVRRKPDLPQYWQHYQDLNRPAHSPKLPLEALTFSVIDVESTGLDPKKDKMIAFAGIRIQNLKIWVRESLEIVINHEGMIKDYAIHIHEITQKEKQKGVSEDEAIGQIIEFIGRSIVAGYHVRLDHLLINQSLKRLLGKKLLNPIINIPDLIKRIEAPIHQVYPATGVDLKEQCEAYGIGISDQHTAAGDAFAAAQLFLKVLSRLGNRGIRNQGGLLKK